MNFKLKNSEEKLACNIRRIEDTVMSSHAGTPRKVQVYNDFLLTQAAAILIVSTLTTLGGLTSHVQDIASSLLSLLIRYPPPKGLR